LDYPHFEINAHASRVRLGEVAVAGSPSGYVVSWSRLGDILFPGINPLDNGVFATEVTREGKVKPVVQLAEGPRLGGVATAATDREAWVLYASPNQSGVMAVHGQAIPLNAPPTLIDPVLMTGGQFGTRLFTSQSNLRFELQASTNLIVWNSLGTLTNQAGATPVVDEGASGFKHRFYRLKGVE
jgi:hypothetical protein